MDGACQFVPVFTDPAELAAGLPDAEGRPVPMSELVSALPEEFGIVVDPTSAAEANFLHADVLAQMRAQGRASVGDTKEDLAGTN